MNVTPPSERALVVAKKDFLDAARSKLLIGLGIFFVIAEVIMTLIEAKILIPVMNAGEGATAAEVTRSIAGHSVMFVGFVAVLIAYRSIAGERASGSLKILMSAPLSRSDIVLGKVLGRWAVLALPLTVGFSVATILGWILVGGIDIPAFLLGLFAVVAFALTYVAIVVALSASIGSTMRVVALSVFLFLFFQFMWDFVPTILYLGVEYIQQGDSVQIGALLTKDWPAWTFLFNAISPNAAFDTSINLVTGREVAPPLHPVVGSIFSLIGLIQAPSVTDTWYATNWLGPISLLLWTVLSVALGYVRFELADL
ncbi:MAG: ABC transporter permease [Halococcoides sp.]